MQPKFTQKESRLFCVPLLALLILSVISTVSFAQDKTTVLASTVPSVGAAPIQAQTGVTADNPFPDAGSPTSRAYCYTGAGPFQLNYQSLLNTTLTPRGATQPYGFPGAAAWVTTTNKMYVIDQAAPFGLYIVDTLTGAKTFVANCTGVPQANFTGLTWDPSTNTMYGASTSLAVSQIFTVNITTGVCTPIGSPTTVAPGVIMLNCAPGGGSLFATDIVNDNLYKFNKTTGVATLVGPLGFNANFGQDGHFDISDGQYYYACFNATAFQAQLRVLDTLTGSSTLVGTYAGQVETFAIYTPPQPPCTGTPNPGNTIASVTNACPAVPLTLTLQNYTPGSGVSYQWQTAPASTGPWTNGGPNGATWQLLQTSPTWYRAIVTCGANSGTSTPVFVDQNPFYNCYCINPASSNADEDVFNVTFGALNNSSTCTSVGPGPGSIQNRYSNYRTIVPTGTTAVTGSLPISIQIGTCGGNFPNGAVAWVDFDHNGVFDHPAERIFYETSTTTGPHTATGMATIPSNALPGITGMRVIAVENIGGPVPGAQTPCGPYTWGETEDYLVNIQPCIPLPVSGVTAPATVNGECSGIVAIPVNTGNASFPSFQWEYRKNASSSWQMAVNGGLNGSISGATTGTLLLLNAPDTLNGYQFRAIVSNPCSAMDFTAPPTTVIMGKLVARVTPTSATICNGTLQQLTLLSPQATFCSGTINVTVPDFNAVGITNSLTVSGIPTSATITEIRVTFNMTQTWVGDNIVNLRAPNGQTINLFGGLDNGTGSNGSDDFTNTTVSSDNTRPAMSGAPAPRTGIFRADRFNPTSSVFGTPTSLPSNTNSWAGLMNAATINGTWTLGLGDWGPGDVALLKDWCITISYGTPISGTWVQSPVPALPASPYAGMWLNAGGTIPYTGGPASQIWVNPNTNRVYTVVASTTNPVCVSDSTRIPVNVVHPLSAVVPPANKSVCTGGTTNFTVTATSIGGAPYNGPFNYQWQESRDNGLTWQNVTNGGVYSGATTNTLTLTGVTRSAPSDMNLYRYRAIVTDGACGNSQTTASAVLTVFALPNVTITASDLALTPGQNSTITATSTPNPLTPTSWSWTLNGSTITGANTNSVVADINKLGVYRATVTDANGCVNSSNSLLIESEVSDRLWIYPNPTTGKFQVRWYYSNAYTDIRRVKIYNGAGQVIMSRDFPMTSTTPHYLQMDFDLSGLSGGVYVVQVSDLLDKKHVQGLLIKQ